MTFGGNWRTATLSRLLDELFDLLPATDLVVDAVPGPFVLTDL